MIFISEKLYFELAPDEETGISFKKSNNHQPKKGAGCTTVLLRSPYAGSKKGLGFLHNYGFSASAKVEIV